MSTTSRTTERIDWAIRHYRQIVPAPGIPRETVPVRELEVWFRDDLAPLVAEYARRSRFRKLTTWPLRELRSGSGTAARQAVEAVDRSLVQCARTIRETLRSKRVRAALAKTIHRKPLVTNESVLVGGDGVQTIPRTVESYDPLPTMVAQVESIARQFWVDLVNPSDYWHPRTRWLLKEGVQTIESGELVASFNPELHRVGDFMTRALDWRVRVLTDVLNRLGRAILTATREIRPPPPKASERVAADLARVRDKYREMYAVCWPDADAVDRDSCITLLQAYVAYHPNPVVDWLGHTATDVSLGAGVFRRQIAHAGSLEVAERVAAALTDLRRIYAEEPPGRSELDEAIAQGGLAIAEASRQVFWSGAKLDVDWGLHSKPWELLLALARKTSVGGSVDERDIYEDVVSASTMATLYGRLKPHLPPGLRELIVSGPVSRSYRLDLPSHQVRIVDRVGSRPGR